VGTQSLSRHGNVEKINHKSDFVFLRCHHAAVNVTGLSFHITV